MKKLFNNAKEFAVFLVNQHDIRQYPKELCNIYYTSPIHYLHNDMYDKYVRGKSVLACECQEFQQAKQNAIDFTEQFLLQQGYTLSILYNCECIDSDGWTTTYKVTIENVPQQLRIF